MTISDHGVVAETRAFNAELEAQLVTLPRIETLPPQVTRAARKAGRGIFPPPVQLPQARWERVRGRDAEIAVRILEPESTATGTYLHLHGGGWTLGAADEQDPMLWAIVEATGMRTVSVEYRLAPEHPFPAGADDAEDAALWLLERHAGERLAIGGESAGAHLAVLTLLRLRDRHGAGGAFAGANLVFGAFDLSGTPSRRRWGDRYLVLSAPMMEWFTAGFLPGLDLEARRAPEISPLYADLTGLPPALFTCGTLDPLLDDSLFMDARWRAAGNDARLSLWEDAVHGFTAFPTAAARLSHAAQHAFLAGL